MLPLFRNTKNMFMDIIQCVYMDFSENLTIGIKWEPQSLHWSKKQMTVYSGISKTSYGKKIYHPYISHSREHDQPFVNMAMKEMLCATNMEDEEYILIESDNCSAQYKSAEHFCDLQNISNENNKTVIRFYGIEGHGKGEVDHVGGIAKVSARDEITRGVIFSNATEITDHLLKKFWSKESLKYHIVEIHVNKLEERTLWRKRCIRLLMVQFHSMLWFFKPGQSFFLAAPRLCICKQCCNEYGSCEHFSRYDLQQHELRSIPLLSGAQPPTEIISEEDVGGFVTPDSYVALAAHHTSNDNIWFAKVRKINLCSTREEVDDYGNSIPAGTIYFCGNFLERDTVGMKSVTYKLSHKTTYFYKESVIFPYVNFDEGKKGCVFTNEDYTDILVYIEHNGLIHV